MRLASLRRFLAGQRQALFGAVLELVLVFVGVFAAFALADWQQRRAEQQRQLDAIAAVHQDLVRYVLNGRDPRQGFVPYFQRIDERLRTSIARRSLEGLPGLIFGDYFQLELTHNLLDVGRLEDLDLETYRNLARMLVIHSNFMREIERLNDYQMDHVDPLLNEGDAAFFDPGSGTLRPRHAMLPQLTANLAGFAQVTVTLSEELIRTIESRYDLPPADLTPRAQ